MTSKSTRNFVLWRANHACECCGATGNLTMDHIVPRSRNGWSVRHNLMALCFACNGTKADRTLAEFLDSLPTDRAKALRERLQASGRYEHARLDQGRGTSLPESFTRPSRALATLGDIWPRGHGRVVARRAA